jgi:hypothetical protein
VSGLSESLQRLLEIAGARTVALVDVGTGMVAGRPPEHGSVLLMLRPGSGAHRQPDRQAGSRRAEGGGRTTEGEGRGARDS